MRCGNGLYRVFVADPANVSKFMNPGFPQEVASIQKNSARARASSATPLRASRCWMASGYSLVLGWLAFWVLRCRVRAGVDSHVSSVCELPSSVKKWKVDVYCLFLQVRHKFELIFLELSAKNKLHIFFKILKGAKYNFCSYRSYRCLWELRELRELPRNSQFCF